ncbi:MULTISPECIES: DUF3795 domain-containing protein [unclassified Clostridioides]|uniref:DUF3795 domain-containing protein n=1 Tax=unclassified Clostridioides TaxID=2635829 RepID=UPI001D10996B|nr:DUF3795 domain-containing protein [Clostridioides sp. ES-S-0049-03]MCC0677371.1 DUF3795 domain-containing protein [Clostridioides sp. ES-W-0018-02]MCC0712519.1 DUF3795 domain-containing protein [Clostridioides sp. ES-W-0017-02]
MKMPNKIENIMFAPCGMNCKVCYKHCYSKKPCQGCYAGDLGKPEHCRKCNIKECTKIKKIKYCFECEKFPCKLVKNLEKSYNKRYEESLIKNNILAKEFGITTLMEEESKKWTCIYCGGIISLHDSECSECHAKKESK